MCQNIKQQSIPVGCILTNSCLSSLSRYKSRSSLPEHPFTVQEDRLIMSSDVGLCWLPWGIAVLATFVFGQTCIRQYTFSITIRAITHHRILHFLMFLRMVCDRVRYTTVLAFVSVCSCIDGCVRACKSVCAFDCLLGYMHAFVFSVWNAEGILFCWLGCP